MAAVGEVHRQLRDVQEVDPLAPVPDRVRQRFRGFLTFMAEHVDMALNMVLANGGDEAFDSVRARGLLVLAEMIGLDAEHQAVAMALRSFADAVDGLTANWLRQGRPYQVEAMVDAYRALLRGAIHGAAALDPGLDVTAALANI
ncbi:hypothetical protein GCM10029964_118160 [Kibdelosporangium lantanae]